MPTLFPPRKMSGPPSGLPAACAVLAAMFAPVLPAQSAPPAPAPPQPFVKVNQYYVLYTAPVVPYLDKSGALMVGLEGFGRALFAKAPPGDPQAGIYGGDDYGRVTTDPAARAETLALGTHAVTFTAGSATALADGGAVTLEAPARWDAAGRGMVVPARGLARCLGLDARWDPARHVLAVTAPDKMTRPDADSMGGANFPVDRAALVPWRVTHHATDAPAGVRYPFAGSGVPRTPWLLFEARNVTAHALDAEELNVVVLYSKGEMSGNLDGIGRIGANGPSPTVPPGGLRRFPLALQGDSAINSIPLCVVSYPDEALPGNAAAATPVTDTGAATSNLGFIDPSITGQERAAVAQAMAGLRPEDRQNVIVEEPEGFHAQPWAQAS